MVILFFIDFAQHVFRKNSIDAFICEITFPTLKVLLIGTVSVYLSQLGAFLMILSFTRFMIQQSYRSWRLKSGGGVLEKQVFLKIAVLKIVR